MLNGMNDNSYTSYYTDDGNVNNNDNEISNNNNNNTINNNNNNNHNNNNNNRKIIRVCHPDKVSHLPSHSKQVVEAKKIFTALTDAYVAFKTFLEN